VAARPGKSARRPRLAVLDGLRLLAALAVVLFHYVAISGEAWGESPRDLFPAIYPVAAYGWLGVELFFLISGFVICMSAWGRPLGDFFVSRAARLYPMYWVGIAATTAALLVAGSQDLKVSQLLVNLTMLQDPLRVPRVSDVYWTLWIELHFYLLFAIVVWRGVNYRRAVAFCVLWTVASVLAQAIAVPAVDVLVSPQYSMYFIAGIAMFLMHRYGQSLLLWAIIGTSWVLALRHIVIWAKNQARQTEGVVTAGGTSLVVTLIFLVMLAVSLGWLSWIRGRWLTVAGALTYPLYLIHWETGWAAIERLRTVFQPWAALLIVIATMLIVAWLLHRLLEKPLQPRLRRGLSKAIDDMRERSAVADENPPPVVPVVDPPDAVGLPAVGPLAVGPTAVVPPAAPPPATLQPATVEIAQLPPNVEILHPPAASSNGSAAHPPPAKPWPSAR
jgi:peptidoglycan/LPS O-acetylase OafA/YrhL